MSKLKDKAKQVAQTPTPQMEQIKDITPAKSTNDPKAKGLTPSV